MLINTKDIPLVDMDFMNEVHHEEVELINRLFETFLAYEKEANQTHTQDIEERYQTWYTHTVEHFQREEEKMRELNFPPYLMHKGEHDKALQRMDEVIDHWHKNKDIQALKMYIIEELPTWLTHHIETMDTITARFFKSGLSPCALH